jgi:hypothetical protein
MKTQYWHSAFTGKNFNFFNVMMNRLVFVALFSSTSSIAHPMIQSWQNRTGSTAGFSINPKLSYFNSSQNFDATSKIILNDNNAIVNRTYFDVNASYGFNENLFIFARLSAIYTSISTTGLNNFSTFGLSDQLIGAAYRAVHLENGTSISLQAETTIPAYSNDSAKINQSPFLGDQTYDMTFGAFAEIPVLSKPTYQFYLDAGAGYTYRSYGYSAAVPWNVQLKRYPVKDGLLLSLGARGNLSLQNDTLSQSLRDNDRHTGAIGSHLIGGFNPSWILGQASIGYQDKNDIQYVLSSAYPITGNNIADGIQFTLGIQFDFAPGKEKATIKKPSTISKGKFVQYDLIAKIISTNDQLYLVKIDQGSDSGVEVGQVFDIFAEEGVIAKAKVTNVKNEESALRVIEYLKEKSIETDTIAKRVVKDQ